MSDQLRAIRQTVPRTSPAIGTDHIINLQSLILNAPVILRLFQPARGEFVVLLEIDEFCGQFDLASEPFEVGSENTLSLALTEENRVQLMTVRDLVRSRYQGRRRTDVRTLGCWNHVRGTVKDGNDLAEAGSALAGSDLGDVYELSEDIVQDAKGPVQLHGTRLNGARCPAAITCGINWTYLDSCAALADRVFRYLVNDPDWDAILQERKSQDETCGTGTDLGSTEIRLKSLGLSGEHHSQRGLLEGAWGRRGQTCRSVEGENTSEKWQVGWFPRVSCYIPRQTRTGLPRECQ